MTLLFHNARKLDVDGRVDDFWALIDGGTISSTGTGATHPPADTAIDLGGAWLVPGFIDLHGHGGGGHTYDGESQEILAALATHRARGTTRSVLSLVTRPIDQLKTSLAAVAGLAEHDPLILGSHLEGPYLAHQRRGAHHPDFLHNPNEAELNDLIDASRQTLKQMTIAPELPGALRAIDTLVGAGIAVAIGHTEADFAVTTEAFERGASILTHVFNAMPGIHHRAPGPIIAAFEDDRVTIELILDGLHVRAEVAEIVFRSAPGRVALITDAMAAAGSRDGDYRLGSLNVSVRNGLAVLSGTSTLAGSTLTQDVALRYAITEVGITPRDAITALTAAPARALGLERRLGRLAAGYAADAVALDGEWNVQRVWADGEQIAGS